MCFKKEYGELDRGNGGGIDKQDGPQQELRLEMGT